ncbi:MAG: bifunctional diaminohydroxyphosphoribosylaminopyrimidine deaminase/5-amino-6-(5-phosphoribosylamino)uracil reductase RibD [Duodenibacillus sp.]|nr:bifunctional diaminohydroxyphosphoribosylaminopyrimidine deaminase/5-amino-6-(5-phosphoribosylamino)uracil reductase RibD [Duodenibacillus sp.]
MTSANYALPRTDLGWMRMALEEGLKARYIAPPNPAVGCVIVREGKLLGRGHTQRPGGNHAEIEAIEDARRNGFADVKGSVVYVTLEPCSHYGRTPPCANRLVDEKVARVVIAALDPNPQVSGRGAEILEAAGIEVDIGLCDQEAREANIGFFTRMKTGRPWVRMKCAMSLDGRTALKNGESHWITGDTAREDGRRWRAKAQALMTGVGTVLLDDPRMNVRLEGEDLPDPVKYVLDSYARTPLTAQVLSGAPCVLFVSPEAPAERVAALEARGARVVVLPETEPGRIDLEAALAQIAADGVNTLHVEAGASLNGAMIGQCLVDEMLIYVAPVMLGPGKPMAALPPQDRMDHIWRWERREAGPCGNDMRLILRRKLAGARR